MPFAIADFLAQTYPSKELLILDDGEDAVADLVPAHPAIRYVRAERPAVLDAKRNALCELARGAIVAHWDDDDWHAAHRLALQVATLEEADYELCGITRPLFFEPASGRAWQYVYPSATRPWLSGSTQV